MTQISLRLNQELLEHIQDLADYEGIKRMDFIRKALTNFVYDFYDILDKEAIKDYINLRIDDDELKEFTGIVEIPEDIKEERRRVLKNVSEGF